MPHVDVYLDSVGHTDQFSMKKKCIDKKCSALTYYNYGNSNEVWHAWTKKKIVLAISTQFFEW